MDQTLLPLAWKTAPLRDHLREPIRNGYSPVCPSKDTGKWILHLGSVTAAGLNPLARKPAPANDPRVDSCELAPGDVLVSRSNTRERVGLAGLYLGEPRPCAYPDLLMRVRPGPELDPAYLVNALLSPNGRNYFERSARGTSGSMVKINREILESFPLLLPPLPEQRKIAAILSSVDETIEKTEAVIAQLEVVKKAMLEELLTRGIPGRHSRFKMTEIGEVPEEWAIQQLGEIADLVNGRAFSEKDWKKSGVPIIRIQNLNGGSEFNYFQGATEDRFAVRPGDLLFSWSGTRGTSFGPHKWIGPHAVLNQHIFNVKNLRGVSQRYLLWALRFVTVKIEKAAHGGSGLVHITKGALEKFHLPVPSTPEQTAIADRLEAADDTTRSTERELAAGRALKRSLAEALLSGTLRTVPGERVA